jgi:cytochrome oxidase Cu insertion factor (SCO1/SenC/PrrC family)
MSRRIHLLVTVTVIVVAVGCANPTTTEPSCGPDVETGLAVGDCAPDFSMPNRDGVPFTLYSQRGKVALVDISAIW